MEIFLMKNRATTLKDVKNFKKLDIKMDDPAMQDHEALAALGPGAEVAGEAEFWISTDYVRALADCGSDADWQQEFTKMLEAVRPYGWSNTDLTRVRVHVKRP